MEVTVWTPAKVDPVPAVFREGQKLYDRLELRVRSEKLFRPVPLSTFYDAHSIRAARSRHLDPIITGNVNREDVVVCVRVEELHHSIGVARLYR